MSNRHYKFLNKSLGKSIAMILLFYFSTHFIISMASSEGLLSDKLIADLDVADKDRVRYTLQNLDNVENSLVVRLLENIWDRKDDFQKFSYPEVFDDPVIRLVIARQLLLRKNSDLNKYSEYIKSKARSRNWIVRANAADALTAIKDDEAADLLCKIAFTPHRLVALRAVRALESSASSLANADPVIDCLNELKGSLTDGDKIVKKAIFYSLERLSSKSINNKGMDNYKFKTLEEMNNSYPFKNSIAELEASAGNGDARSQHILGERYLIGLGVVENHNIAKNWIEKSAEKNYSPAKISLAQMYLSGRGVQRSLDRAIELLEEASSQGDIEAKKLLEFINEKKK